MRKVMIAVVVALGLAMPGYAVGQTSLDKITNSLEQTEPTQSCEEQCKQSTKICELVIEEVKDSDRRVRRAVDSWGSNKLKLMEAEMELRATTPTNEQEEKDLADKLAKLEIARPFMAAAEEVATEEVKRLNAAGEIWRKLMLAVCQ